MPSIAALAFNRRWKSVGTFRICTMVFDIRLAYFHRFIMSTGPYLFGRRVRQKTLRGPSADIGPIYRTFGPIACIHLRVVCGRLRDRVDRDHRTNANNTIA
jgi:hypothetical protein